MSATRADVLGAAAIVAVTLGFVLVPAVRARLSPHASRDECEALLERYVEMKERAFGDKVDPQRRAAALEEARRTAGASLAQCTAEVTRDELECTRAANNADEVERCLR
ncbi:MAG: hypothetical protein R3B70_35440 [Polyangiaceae bacterium]